MRALRVGSDSTLARIVRAVEDAQGSKARAAHGRQDRGGVRPPHPHHRRRHVLRVVLPRACRRRCRTRQAGAFACHRGHRGGMSLRARPGHAHRAHGGHGQGAQLGVLIKDGEVLECLCKLDVAVFDKTGTVTVGSPRVVACDVSPDHLRMAAARLSAKASTRSHGRWLTTPQSAAWAIRARSRTSRRLWARACAASWTARGVRGIARHRGREGRRRVLV